MKKINNKATKYYLVRYYGGSYDDSYDEVLFITDKKSRATKYCTKFNKLLKKWTQYYEQFETTKYGMKWIADEYIEKHFERWHQLRNISKCYYREVDYR